MRGLLSGEFTEIRSLSWGATFTDKNFVTEKDDVEASFLVMDAERDITKANPPEGRGLAADKNSVLPEDTKISNDKNFVPLCHEVKQTGNESTKT